MKPLVELAVRCVLHARYTDSVGLLCIPLLQDGVPFHQCSCLYTPRSGSDPLVLSVWTDVKSCGHQTFALTTRGFLYRNEAARGAPVHRPITFFVVAFRERYAKVKNFEIDMSTGHITFTS